MLRVSKTGTSVRTVVIWFAGQPSTKENKLHALNRDEHSTIMWTHLCASTRCPQFMTEFLSDSDDTTQNCMLSWRSYHLSSETTLSKMAHNFAASFEWSKKSSAVWWTELKASKEMPWFKTHFLKCQKIRRKVCCPCFSDTFNNWAKHAIAQLT